MTRRPQNPDGGVPQSWQLARRSLPLGRPIVMGVLNVTPDSFSDGGEFFSLDRALAHGERLVAEGAQIVDVGGESSRPQGATVVPASEERRRVLPVIEALRERHPDVAISVDTVKGEVARAALDAGAEIVNDVSALRLDPSLAGVCAEHGAGVILMHSRGGVSDMATYTHANYGDDPTGEVIVELNAQVEIARAAGIADDRIVLDPGVGFSKRSEHSLRILAELDRLVAQGFAVAVGVSRKRFIGELSGVSVPAERVEGTIAGCVMALMAGARIFRVHDVRAVKRALDVAWGIMSVSVRGTQP